MTTHAYITDKGRVRDHNEDAYACVPELGLWVVADGMGGHEAGEVAGAIVTEHVPKRIAAGATLAEALESSHQAILDAVERGTGARGMGCTALAMQLIDDAYTIAWVGDCRAYLFDGSLHRLTRDHAFAEQLLAHGIITAEEARTHPNRNVVTRALGADGKNFKPETVEGRLLPGQSLVLCSDGLTHELEDREISTIMAAAHDAEEAARNLVRAANDHGGRDNITVVVIRASAVAEEKAAASKASRTIPENRQQPASMDRTRSPMGYAMLFLILWVVGFLAWWLW